MTILPVRQMYSFYNFRYLSGDNTGRSSEYHGIWEERNTKTLVFLHGANVSEADAEKWGDALFKRLWHAGCGVNFVNVDWRSDIGSNANYQQNASNAFVVAGQIADDIKAIPGDKVMMAHSLGNMVVSSMIQDHGLQVSKYLMCDSSVPAEAYDTSPSLRVPHSSIRTGRPIRRTRGRRAGTPSSGTSRTTTAGVSAGRGGSPMSRSARSTSTRRATRCWSC